MSDTTLIRDSILAPDFSDRVDDVLQRQHDGILDPLDFAAMAEVLRLPTDFLEVVFAARLALRSGEAVTIFPGSLGGLQ